MTNYSTSFYINLAGNLQAKSAQFGQSVVNMSQRSVRALGKMQGTVAKVSNQIDKVGNRIAIATTAAGALAGRTLIKTAAEFEMAQIRMKQTFGADGDKVFAWITEFATKTPMQFQDVQDAAMRLKTAGIDPMNGSLQALVDYNAKIGGNQENLNGYIAAISKANIKGKLSWEEINPLLERNIPVFEMLAKADGGKHTADDFKKMLSQGKLQRGAIQALLKQMGIEAKGAAAQQMQTWDGMMSNIEDNLTAMQAKIMEKGIFDELKKEVGSVLAWINQKMDSGEFDQAAKKISDGLVAALRELKSLGKSIYPTLEKLGEALSWLADKAGGYGNLAKFAGALYLANKAMRSGIGQGVTKGALGAGRWAVNKFRKGKGNTGNTNTSALASGLGAGEVSRVFVVNFPDMGIGGRGKRGKRGRNRPAKPRKPTKNPHTQARKSPKSAVSPKVGGKAKNITPTKAAPVTAKPNATLANKVGNGLSQVARNSKTAVTTAAKTTSNAMRSSVKALSSASKGLSKAVPLASTAIALADTATVLLDDEASSAEKGEAIGSAAGATIGAVVGQALIPIPVVGAMVGGMLGDWLGGWLGSEVGEKLAEPEKAQENKLNGQINVNIKATEGLMVSSAGTNLTTSNPRDSLKMQTETGYSGRALYGGN